MLEQYSNAYMQLNIQTQIQNIIPATAILAANDQSS